MGATERVQRPRRQRVRSPRPPRSQAGLQWAAMRVASLAALLLVLVPAALGPPPPGRRALRCPCPAPRSRPRPSRARSPSSAASTSTGPRRDPGRRVLADAGSLAAPPGSPGWRAPRDGRQRRWKALRPRQVRGGRGAARSVHVLDRGRWRVLPRMPFPRAAAGAGVARGRIVVAGGVTYWAPGPQCALVRPREAALVRRCGADTEEHLGVTALAGVIYAIGGRTAGLDTNLLHFESYRAGERRLAPAATGARPARRHGRRRSGGSSSPWAGRGRLGRSPRFSPTACPSAAGCSSRTCRRRGTASASQRSGVASS